MTPEERAARRKELAGKAQVWIELHPWFALGVVLSVVLTAGVAPIRAILLDLPSASVWLRLDRNSLLALGLWIYTVLLAGGWLLAVAVTQSDPSTPGRWTGWRARVASVPHVLAGGMERWLFLPLSRLRRGARWLIGAAVLALGSLWWLGAAASSEVVDVIGPLSAGWGISAMCLGAWLLLARIDPGLPAHGWGRGSKLAGRALILLQVSTLIGHLMWQLADSPDTALTWRLFTFWAISHATMTIVLVGQVVDGFGRTLVHRLALGVPLLLAVFCGVAMDVPIGHVEARTEIPTASRDQGWGAVPSEGPAPDEAWFDAVEARLDRIPPDEPVLFVAAAGGGSRSALYATLVLESLERTPPEGSYGDWAEPEEEGSLADRVLFISSVSGGSVAAAHFAYGGDDTPLRTPTNTIPKELQLHFLTELDTLCSSIAQGCAAEREVLPPFGDRACRVEARLCLSPQAELPESAAGFDRQRYAANPADTPWPVGSRRFDDLATDFNAPMLRGLVGPAIERGESMTHFWRAQFGWHQRYLASTPGERPVLLVNLTDALTGNRVVASFPPVPAGFRGTGPESYARGMADLHPELEVQLEEAVRMSANFPWGFDVPLLGLGPEEQRIRAIDGGVLDNTGVDTFAVLLERLEELSHPAHAGEHPEWLSERAGELLEELAERGVIVLEIDSGAKPEPPGMVSALLANATYPVQSLNVSSYVRATEATSDHVEAMGAILDRKHDDAVAARHREEGSTRPPQRLAGDRLIHVKYVLDTERIMTAWALTPTQKGQLLARFLAEDTGQRTRTRAAFERLQGRNRGECRLIIQAHEDEELADLLRALAQDQDDSRRAEEEAVLHDADVRRRIYDGAPPPPEPVETLSAEGWIRLGVYPARDASELVETFCPVEGETRWFHLAVGADQERAPEELEGGRFTVAETVLMYAEPPDLSVSMLAPTRLLHPGDWVAVQELRFIEGSDLVFARVSTTGR